MAARDHWEAGHRVFPLNDINPDGTCGCGDSDCQAAGKHPKVSSWQHTPDWSEEQFDAMEEYAIGTGYGVCVDGCLVVDVDPRNGGFDGLKALNDHLGLDIEQESEFVVNTGGGGLHIWFGVEPPKALNMHDDRFAGIDFKSNGYVVGYGSIHASGALYERAKGFPQDIGQAPDSLLELLRKKEHMRTEYNGEFVDLTNADISALLDYCKSYDDYDDWVSVGMAIHHATQGNGYELWDNWSQQSDKYDAGEIGKKWHSFGKCANPVTIGTLINKAEQAGWKMPVTFDSLPSGVVAPTVAYQDEDPSQLPFDTSNIDLKRPPGFIGSLVKWMNGNSWDEPLENLNVITAITAIGNIIGLHTTCDVSGVSPNLLTLCIADSSTGKETVQQSFAKIMDAAGMGGAVAGDIKSKQEIVRNLIEHQACFYMVDELGEILTVIENAKRRGGAAYLEGTTGLVMNVFTKANSHLKVTGDTRRELVAELNKELSMCCKKVDENEDQGGGFSRRKKQLEEMIPVVRSKGLPRPFLSLIGYSVPDSMEVIMSESMAKNGFLSRALLAVEQNDNPRPRMDATGPSDLPDSYKMTIMGMASTGTAGEEQDRIEFYGKKTVIESTPDAREQLTNLRLWQSDYAELHRETTGFTPVIRRFWELVGKISLILAAPERLRTIEHVKWAAALVKRDIEEKIRYVEYTKARDSKSADTVKTGIQSRIEMLCKGDSGETERILLRKCRINGVSQDDVKNIIAEMVKADTIKCTETKAKNGSVVRRYHS